MRSTPSMARPPALVALPIVLLTLRDQHNADGPLSLLSMTERCTATGGTSVFRPRSNNLVRPFWRPARWGATIFKR